MNLHIYIANKYSYFYYVVMLCLQLNQKIDMLRRQVGSAEQDKLTLAEQLAAESDNAVRTHSLLGRIFQYSSSIYNIIILCYFAICLTRWFKTIDII